MTIVPRGWRHALDFEAAHREGQLALLFIAPAFLILTLLVGWSIIYALYLSFQTLTVSGGQISYEFAGLSNYLRFLEDERLHQTIGQTVVYTSVRVSGILLVGMALALVLNESAGVVEFLKRMFLIPWALSFVVNALMWGWIYHGNFGALNAILVAIGAIDKYHVWLAEPVSAMAAILFADIWKSVPVAALMLLAALQGVPRDLEDAAKVDGANSWGRFRYVVLPFIRPVVLVLLVVETMWAFKAFDLIWVLTKGGPLDTTMVLNVYTYQQTFQFFNFGYGSAVAYLITVLILGLTVAYIAALRGFED
jgi:ABC-type sugar transport system permease subunit